jgi:hypothetical protein
MSIGWLLFKTECKIKMNTVSATGSVCFDFRLSTTISLSRFTICSWSWLRDGPFRRRCFAVWYSVSIKWIYIRSRQPRTLRWVTLCGPYAYRGQWLLALPDTGVSHIQLQTPKCNTPTQFVVFLTAIIIVPDVYMHHLTPLTLAVYTICTRLKTFLIDTYLLYYNNKLHHLYM